MKRHLWGWFATASKICTSTTLKYLEIIALSKYYVSVFYRGSEYPHQDKFVNPNNYNSLDTIITVSILMEKIASVGVILRMN